MRKETRQFLKRQKSEIMAAAESMPNAEREDFYYNLEQWAYGKYEETLYRNDADMQDYDK